jgi:hypothetical protein
VLTIQTFKEVDRIFGSLLVRHSGFHGRYLQVPIDLNYVTMDKSGAVKGWTTKPKLDRYVKERWVLTNPNYPNGIVLGTATYEGDWLESMIQVNR